MTLSLEQTDHHHPAPWAHLIGQEEFLDPEEVTAPHVTSLKLLFLAVERGDFILLLLWHLMFILTVSSMQGIKSSVTMVKNHEMC